MGRVRKDFRVNDASNGQDWVVTPRTAKSLGADAKKV